jgi:hypothetical protein
MTMMTNKGAYTAWLADAREDKVFWCYDGMVVKNLDELVVAIREMSQETFRHHASGGNNDFSNWVRDVIGDVTLANQLRKATTQSTAAHKVETRLNSLRARL